MCAGYYEIGFFFFREEGVVWVKVHKVINNNIVGSFDEHGEELIIMGRGIGFGLKENQIIPDEKIEKIFRMDNEKSLKRFKDLVADIPLEYLQVSTEIINYAKQVLDQKLSSNIYLTLSDHINFAIERQKQNIQILNPLFREIKTYYRAEYQIGTHAVELIRRRTGIVLPPDEASSIALHIVNAEYDLHLHDVINMMSLVQNMLEIVLSYFNITISSDSLNYERFITHLKFLAQRIFSNEPLESGNPEFAKAIADMYPDAHACSLAIRDYIAKTCDRELTHEETAYLTVYIQRIAKR